MSQRITVRSGKLRRSFVIVKPPFAKVGDILASGEMEWSVTKAVDVGEVLSIKFPNRLAQKPEVKP